MKKLEGKEWKKEMPSKDFNKSINAMKKEEINARKRAKDTIALANTELPFSHLFNSEKELDTDSSNIMYSHHIDKGLLDETNIVISETEKYTASYLMMPELMQGSTSVIQVVPREVSFKIDDLFYQDKYKQMYMMLKLQLNGFTLTEIGEFFGGVTKQTVTVAIKRAKKRVLDNLTVEELATCYWWLRVPKPVLPKKEELIKEVKPVDKKATVKNNWSELEAIYNNFQGR
jgi:hypothetical protein